MTLLEAFFVVLSGAGTAVALLAGSHVEVTLPAALVAVAAAAALGFGRMSPTLRRRVASRPTLAEERPAFGWTSNPLLTLRRGFAGGRLGRQTVLASLRALERDLSPVGRTPLSIEQERDLLQLPTSQFRQWVESRLELLEAAT